MGISTTHEKLGQQAIYETIVTPFSGYIYSSKTDFNSTVVHSSTSTVNNQHEAGKKIKVFGIFLCAYKHLAL
jgi:hypothetical protein